MDQELEYKSKYYKSLTYDPSSCDLSKMWTRVSVSWTSETVCLSLLVCMSLFLDLSAFHLCVCLCAPGQLCV